MREITKEYLHSLLHFEGKLYELKSRAHDEEHIPVITDDVLQLIHTLIQTKQIKSILEIGTAVGVSAMYFREFIGEDANITTIERDDRNYIEANENIRNFGYQDCIHVCKGDADEILPGLNTEYDMIFLDGNKGHYIYMLDDCIRLLKPNGLLIADNVLFRGMVSKQEKLIRRKITIVKRLRKFLTAITERDDLVTTVLPIGDGVSISVKKNV